VAALAAAVVALAAATAVVSADSLLKRHRLLRSSVTSKNPAKAGFLFLPVRRISS
jgi:hypothetical protein